MPYCGLVVTSWMALVDLFTLSHALPTRFSHFEYYASLLLANDHA